MIVGENGVGKELLAGFIHQHSPRASQPFVALSCSAFPEHALEFEMFGSAIHSVNARDGNGPPVFEYANGGTCFLDEVADVPSALQPRLLRVVNDGVFRGGRGGTPPAHVDIRFISSMTENPLEAVRAKRLREDLYFALNVFTIRVPPLRERASDIPLLVRYFFEVFWTKHHPAGMPRPSIDAEAMAVLSSRPWHGNVRELQNVVEHLVVLADPGSRLGAEHIPSDDASTPALSAEFDGDKKQLDESYHRAKDQVLAEFEKDYITRLVAKAAGNMSRAARIADVDRTTLYRMLERNGFNRDVRDA